MNKKDLVVVDANILIDIEDGNLTSSMFSLTKRSFCVPDILFERELKQKHSHLLRLGLNLSVLSGKSVERVFALAQKHSKTNVSRIDLFALQLALERSALLLTGDKMLRKIANNYQIECHGTIWLVELMVKQNIISKPVAKNAYEKMCSLGSRLPWKEAEKRLAMLK